MDLVQTDPKGSKILRQYLGTWWSSDFHCFSCKGLCPFVWHKFLFTVSTVAYLYSEYILFTTWEKLI